MWTGIFTSSVSSPLRRQPTSRSESLDSTCRFRVAGQTSDSVRLEVRASAYRHLKMVFKQQGWVDKPIPTLNKRKGRGDILRDIEDPVLSLSLTSDIQVMNDMDQVIDVLEQKIDAEAKHHDRAAFELLKTIPGGGDILALTLHYEIHITRYPSVQKFSSYCQLVKPERTSNGKNLGFGNDKFGNPELKCAFTQLIIHDQLNSPGPGLKALHEKMKQKITSSPIFRECEASEGIRTPQQSPLSFFWTIGLFFPQGLFYRPLGLEKY